MGVLNTSGLARLLLLCTLLSVMGALTKTQLKNLVHDDVLALPKGPEKTMKLAFRAAHRAQAHEDASFRRSQEYFRGHLSLDYHDHGEMTKACTQTHDGVTCNAQYYAPETKGFKKDKWPCCTAGVPSAPRLPSADARLDGILPRELNEMHTQSKMGKELYEHWRELNHMFSFASAEMNYTKGGEARVIRIQGRIHRYCSGAAKPPPGVVPAFAQLYFVGDEQTDLRAAKHDKVARGCIEYVYSVLKKHNKFVQDTLASADQLLEDHAEASFEVLYDAKRIPPSVHKGTMQAPGGREGQTGVVGILSDDYEKSSVRASDRAVVLNAHSKRKTQRVRYDNPNFDPLHYPLLFPTAMAGWDRLNTTTPCKGGAPPVNETCLDFQKARLTQRFNTRDHGGARPSDVTDEQLRQRDISLQEHLFTSGKAFQEFIIESYTKVLDNNCEFVERDDTQEKLVRYRTTAGACRAAQTKGISKIGSKRVICPRSMIGSPADFRSRYNDAMKLIQLKGKPDLFITMTTNANWPEIQRELLPGESWENRPDLVCRVYRMKMLMLIDLIEKHHAFGQPAVVVGVTEYQKCALPHCHILVCLEQKLETPDQFDSVVCAELPCSIKAKKLHDMVVRHMIHRPCTNDALCPCRKGAEDDRGVAPTTTCQKHFPKELRESTGIADDIEAYPQYRRRGPEITRRTDIDGRSYAVTEAPGHTVEHPKFQYKAAGGQQVPLPSDATVRDATRGVGYTPRNTRVTNEWVVPYNPALLMLMDCHVNVEVTSSINCVKYLFKYVYKGNDRVIYKLREALSAGDEENSVQEYRAARILTGCESYFCIRFPNQRFHMYPKILPLEVHTEDTTPVSIKEGDVGDDGDMADAIDAALSDPTTTKLSRYLGYCASHREGKCDGYCTLPVDESKNFRGCQEPPAADTTRCTELTYEQFPRHYTWCGPKGGWVRRARVSQQYGRMHRVPLKTGEPYYARVLLTKVKGATCFEDLKRLDDGSTAETYREACYASRDAGSYITDDDAYWDDVLEKEGARSTPDELLEESKLIDSQSQYRHMFVMVLQHGMPARPEALFEKHKKSMANDYARRLQQDATSGDCQRLLLGELHRLMDQSEFGDDDRRPIPDRPDQTWVAEQANQRDVESAQQRLDAALERIENDVEQEFAYDRITRSISRKEPELFWLNAIAGAGKTTVVNAILDYCIVSGVPAVATATTGIAAELLHRATTFHSATGAPLKIPAHAREFGFGAESRLAAVLKPATVVVVDEATMLHHVLLDSLDLTLRSLESRGSIASQTPFAGKVILLAGDYQQQLPVVRKGNELDVQEATLLNAECWNSRIKLRLSTNHRMRLPPAPDDSEASRRLRNETEAYQEFCDRVGRGTEQIVDGTERTIRLPEGLMLDCRNADTKEAQIERMVDHIYADPPAAGPKRHEWLASRRIVTPKNVHVAEINQIAMSRFKGRCWTSHSIDTMEPGEETERSAIPEKVMHAYKPPGMPPHELKLQVGIPYSLTRNYDKGLGLSNGTVVVLTGFDCSCGSGCTDECQCNVTCVSATVPGSRHLRPNQEIRIPRIIFLPDEQDYCPFMFRRRQFPLMPCLASTIMKSQGQSLQSTAVYLPSPCFTHGQLYVAITRTESAAGVKVLALDADGRQTSETENVVNPVIIQNIGKNDSDGVSDGNSDGGATESAGPSGKAPPKPKQKPNRANAPNPKPRRKAKTTQCPNPRSKKSKGPKKRKEPHGPALISLGPASARRATRGTLARFMSAMGRQRVAANGDGHCGFRAMAMQETALTGVQCTVDAYYDKMIEFSAAAHACPHTCTSIRLYQQRSGTTLKNELTAAQERLRAGSSLHDGWFSTPDHVHWAASILGATVLVLTPFDMHGHQSGSEPPADEQTEHICVAYYAAPGRYRTLTMEEAQQAAYAGAAVLIHNGRPGTPQPGANFTDVGHFDSLCTASAALTHAQFRRMDNQQRIRRPPATPPALPAGPPAPLPPPALRALPAGPLAPLPPVAPRVQAPKQAPSKPRCPGCSSEFSKHHTVAPPNSSKWPGARYYCAKCNPQNPPELYAICTACTKPVRDATHSRKEHRRRHCKGARPMDKPPVPCPSCSAELSLQHMASSNSSNWHGARYHCTNCIPQDPPVRYAVCTACTRPVRDTKRVKAYHRDRQCSTIVRAPKEQRARGPPLSTELRLVAEPPAAQPNTASLDVAPSGLPADWELSPWEPNYHSTLADQIGIDEHELLSRDELSSREREEADQDLWDFMAEKPALDLRNLLGDMGAEYSAMDFAGHQRASAAAGDSDSNYTHNNEDTYAANDGAGSDRGGTKPALGACFDDEACESDDSGGGIWE